MSKKQYVQILSQPRIHDTSSVVWFHHDRCMRILSRGFCLVHRTTLSRLSDRQLAPNNIPQTPVNILALTQRHITELQEKSCFFFQKAQLSSFLEVSSFLLFLGFCKKAHFMVFRFLWFLTWLIRKSCCLLPQPK